jgi:hypothetical protein
MARKNKNKIKKFFSMYKNNSAQQPIIQPWLKKIFSLNLSTNKPKRY